MLVYEYKYVDNFLFAFIFLQDDIESRPRVSTFISSLANYSNTIPAVATDPDAKPPAPAARMGMYMQE